MNDRAPCQNHTAGPDKPGIALLSFAHGHQPGWANVFRADGRVNVVCAWDSDAARGAAAAGRLDVPFIPSLDDVLSRRDVAAVTICSTNDTHAGLAVAAARAGKHIMMQKPMATTRFDCDRIVDAVEAAGVRYYQSHNLRFDPVHQEIKRLVDAGEIGRIGLARRRHSHAFALLNAKVLEWMSDPLHGGGGAFMDEGAHVALWFLWMFGAPESVTGVVTTALTEQKPGVEDQGVLLYRYAGGLIGVHQSSWVELASTSTIELFGDRGVVVASGTDISSSRSRTPNEAPLRVWRHDPSGPAGDRPPSAVPNATGEWHVPDVPLAQSRLAGTATAFVDLLAGGGPSPCDARTARTAVEMVLAGYQSSREGREVSLPLAR
ncbi:MAG: Gfo/Idh/MocA family oxidoreductase [Chloroflexi bacterium]|nr:Gfo/Idh/MocA family oxidoreductase [Chloroflexota bacterium]